MLRRACVLHPSAQFILHCLLRYNEKVSGIRHVCVIVHYRKGVGRAQYVQIEEKIGNGNRVYEGLRFKRPSPGMRTTLRGGHYAPIPTVGLQLLREAMTARGLAEAAGEDGQEEPDRPHHWHDAASSALVTREHSVLVVLVVVVSIQCE